MPCYQIHGIPMTNTSIFDRLHNIKSIDYQFCDACNNVKGFNVKVQTVDGLGYCVVSCTDCHLNLAKYLLCCRTLSLRTQDHTNIRRHMNKHNHGIATYDHVRLQNDSDMYPAVGTINLPTT